MFTGEHWGETSKGDHLMLSSWCIVAHSTDMIDSETSPSVSPSSEKGTVDWISNKAIGVQTKVFDKSSCNKDTTWVRPTI